MASPRIEPQKTTTSPSPKWYQRVHWYEWTCIGFLALSLCFFLPFQNYESGVPVDGGLWGQFGDFAGSLLGAFIAYISVRLLVDNLQEQRKSNEKLEASNMLLTESNKDSAKVYLQQQFNSQFATLFDLYKQAKLKYSDKDGQQDALDRKADEFLNAATITEKTYEKVVKDATKQYDNLFYIPNRKIASVHFRVLYLIIKLIEQSQIEESEKVSYAKMVRSQLSERELLLLRYNCLCPYGAKMQDHVNHYNLLKHTPMMSLLEFKSWHNKFDDNQINRLDTVFVSYKKVIKDMLLTLKDKPITYEFHKSERYSIELEISVDNKELKWNVKKHVKAKADSRESSMDAVLDKLKDDEINQLFSDFFTELFVHSNFEKYNQKKSFSVKPDVITQKGNNTHIMKLEVKNDNGSILILSQNQMNTPS